MYRYWLIMVFGMVEIATGLTLLVYPPLPLELLLGVKQASPETAVIARFFGAGILAMGIICYLGKSVSDKTAQNALIWGTLVYNVLAAGLLVYTDLGLHLSGYALWPAALLHAVLAMWGVSCLVLRRTQG